MRPIPIHFGHTRISADKLHTVAGVLSVDPPCRIADRCGGCQLQRQHYTSQLAFKKAFVEDALHAYPSLTNTAIQDVKASANTLIYRNRAQFAIQRSTDGKTTVGLYESNTNTVVDTSYCAIQHKLTNTVLAQFRKLLNAQQLSIYNETTGLGSLRHIVIRTGFDSQEIMVCLVTATHKVPHLQSFVQNMRQIPQVKSILLHYNPLPGDQVIRDTRNEDGSSSVCYTKVLSGKDHIMDTVAGVKCKVSLQSFMQSNPAQTETLYATIADCIHQSSSGGGSGNSSGEATVGAAGTINRVQRNVWDLYCGVGTIGMYLTRLPGVSSVIGVESSEAAVRDAEANAALNNMINIRFIHGAAEDIIAHQQRQLIDTGANLHTTNTATLPLLAPENANSTPPGVGTPLLCVDDIVILNPPRRGCHKALLQAIRESAARTVIYVSCNPTTLARDLDVLIRGADDDGNVLRGNCRDTTVPAVTHDSGKHTSQPAGGRFKVKLMQPVDMFPHTVHIETVVWLERIVKSM